jgi:hypothetical protein
MANPVTRFLAWCFAITVIASSIMYCLTVYEDVTFLAYPSMVLELVAYVYFVAFAARALQGIALRWLWVVLGLVVVIAVPAGVSLLITVKLAAVNAPRPWWYATQLMVCILKLAVAGGIALWRRNRDAGSAMDAAAQTRPLSI